MKMRRYDREITDFNEKIELLRQCPTVRLGLLDEQGVYIVPMNYGFEVVDEQLIVYVHCASAGRKVDAMKQHPHICFEVDHNLKMDQHESACSTTTEYESLIGYGDVEFIEDVQEKKKGLDLILTCNGFEAPEAYNEHIFRVLTVARIKTTELSGKRNPLVKHGS